MQQRPTSTRSWTVRGRHWLRVQAARVLVFLRWWWREVFPVEGRVIPALCPRCGEPMTPEITRPVCAVCAE